MDDIAATDLSLFGLWPGGTLMGRDAGARTREGSGGGWSDARRMRAAGRLMLEVKSAEALSPVDQLAALLNDLTAEMRAQFELFRRLRSAADALMSGEDEATAKLARSDAKAATDAMALMVRTLEKIDSLQRQLARDRAEAEDRAGGDEDHEAIREQFRRTIAARAEERALELYRAWRMDGIDPDASGAGGATRLAEPGAAPGPGGP